MLDQCWSSVVHGGPTMIEHWANVSCLMDSQLDTQNISPLQSENTRLALIPPAYVVSFRGEVLECVVQE